MYRPKMKTLFQILLAPLFWLFQGCSPLGNPVDVAKSDSHYYNNNKSQIRYSPMGNWFELGNSAMRADVESFQVFNKWLSRDKENIFFEAYKVENRTIDLPTFKVINNEYMNDIGFDKNAVYAFSKMFKDKSYRGFAKVIEGADPNTYRRTDWEWANDGKYHYYRDNRIEADFESFKPINNYFAADSNTAYVRNDTVFKAFDADTATFKILDESSHGIDYKNVYWLPFFTKNSPHLLIIPYETESEVEFLNRYFLRIGQVIYYDGTVRKDIDGGSFEIIDHSYSKDVKYVYYKHRRIPNADPESFKPMEGSYKYEDKNGTYHEGKLQEKSTESSN